MKRIPIKPRDNWRGIVEEQGLTFHTIDDTPYWHEAAYYQLSAKEVDDLEAAGNELHRICLEAAEKVIKKGLWERFKIPLAAVPLIEKSWKEDAFSLYGRFDLAYDPSSSPHPKMLEYNADTPTSLLEAAVIQWFWMQDLFKDADQFNSLHEKLIEQWKKLPGAQSKTVHFACVREHLEDEQTVFYLQDLCHQAGFETRRLFMDEIGWSAAQKRFAGVDNEPIDILFKLYPWEWMAREKFGVNIGASSCAMIEPAWKMILSNKSILPYLWELYPEHPNLLPAYFSDSGKLPGSSYVVKPVFGREGGNVKIISQGETLAESSGVYGAEGFIVQKRGPVPKFDGLHPVFGVWIAGGEACGLGVREDKSLITGNTSLFTPHIFYP